MGSKVLESKPSWTVREPGVGSQASRRTSVVDVAYDHERAIHATPQTYRRPSSSRERLVSKRGQQIRCLGSCVVVCVHGEAQVQLNV